jgi:heme-degrading monooxygenase HmoA
VLTDRLDFLQQLGALPQDLTQLSNRQPSGNQVNFIDKFLVPAKAKQEFMERVKINRNFIKNLPGFIEDAAYERTDENGNLVFITIAVWENEDAVKKAKEAVQAEYKKQGFNMPEMLERLNITMDRGMYKTETAP